MKTLLAASAVACSVLCTNAFAFDAASGAWASAPSHFLGGDCCEQQQVDPCQQAADPCVRQHRAHRAHRCRPGLVQRLQARFARIHDRLSRRCDQADPCQQAVDPCQQAADPCQQAADPCKHVAPGF